MTSRRLTAAESGAACPGSADNRAAGAQTIYDGDDRINDRHLGRMATGGPTASGHLQTLSTLTKPLNGGTVGTVLSVAATEGW